MSSVTNNSSKKRRTQSSDDDVDRISNLPESIISHILSLLPTADAVATCLLSTRWKFKWRNIRHLRFTDSSRHFRQSHHTTIEQVSLFAHFVNKVLLFLDQKCIDKFEFNLNQFTHGNDVTSWIAAAVSRNVKTIKFSECIFPRQNVFFDMPCSLFNCKTLEVLHLRGSINLNVPSVVCLPNLRFLLFVGVIFKCDESLQRLISGCSKLESLYVRRYVYDNVVNFIISSPTLRNIILDFKNADNSFPEEIHHKLKINAPQLRNFILSDIYVLKDFSLENLCLLDEAKISLSINESLIRDAHYSKAILKLCQGLYNVKNLFLMGDILKALNHARFSASFLKLSQLYLSIPATCWTHSLLNFIEGSKKLEFLEVVKYICDKSTEGTCWSKPEKVPSCFLSLKTVSLKGIRGMEHEVEMIAYILKNAKFLKTMTIQLPNYLNSQSKLQLVLRLAEFSRGSQECKLHFI